MTLCHRWRNRVWSLVLSPGFTLELPWMLFFHTPPPQINLFLPALGLCCCARAFSSCGKQGLLFVLVHGLPNVVASLVEEHRFWVCKFK